jgi:hypothetical protein
MTSKYKLKNCSYDIANAVLTVTGNTFKIHAFLKTSNYGVENKDSIVHKYEAHILCKDD